jgi:hypothetical protein
VNPDQVTRIAVRQTAAEARCVVSLSRELREHLDRGEHELAGRTAGEMLARALTLLNDGASLRDVRSLIDLGAARAAQTVEPAA